MVSGLVTIARLPVVEFGLKDRLRQCSNGAEPFRLFGFDIGAKTPYVSNLELAHRDATSEILAESASHQVDHCLYNGLPPSFLLLFACVSSLSLP